MVADWVKKGGLREKKKEIHQTVLQRRGILPNKQFSV